MLWDALRASALPSRSAEIPAQPTVTRMNDWTYLWVNLAVLSIPFIASFDRRVAFVKEWKAFWPSCLLTMAGFIAWDVIFTARGINPNFWQQVFGVPQPDEQLVAAPDSKIGSNGDPLGMKVRALIDGIRAHYGGSNAMKLTLVPAGNQAMEGQFINSLFDDRTPGLRLTSQEFEYLFFYDFDFCHFIICS